VNSPIIYPYNSLLEWDDTTSLTLSGSADTSSISVSAVENGVISTARYNATSHEWQYDTNITGYVNNFVIISDDSIGNTASATAHIAVNGPIIIDTASSYNQVNPSLEGRTNEITSKLEASPNSITYSPSGFTHDSFTTNFSYNNFKFLNPIQTYYFIGKDIGNGISVPEQITLNYLMHDPSIYTPIKDPYDSRTVAVMGSADYDIAGFRYAPSGGSFYSTKIENTSGRFTSWTYSFVMMKQSEEFSIKTFDIFGKESAEQKKQINYGVEKPIILLPGSIKVITDNIAISGNTSEEFITLKGDFKKDGIIINDMVLSTTGKNIGEYRRITQVHDLFLVTDSFSHFWEPGDQIQIYPKEDRPIIITDQDDINLSGKCNRNISKVRYSTEELKPIRTYAKNSQGYHINSTNNNLVMNVNGKLEFVILSSGILSAQDVVNQVNSAFNTTFDYDISFSDGERFYIEGQHIHIFSGTANETIGLVEGETNFNLEIEVPDTITFQNSAAGGTECSDEVIESGLLFCMNLDGRYIRFTLNTNTEYTKNRIINKINTLAGKEVATNVGPNIVFNAAKNLWVGDVIEDLNLKKQLNGDANFNSGINLSTDISRDPDSIESGIGNWNPEDTQGYSGDSGKGAGNWNIQLSIAQPSNNFKIYGLSEFYELSEPVSLNIEYKINPPEINTPPATTTFNNFIDLNGTYNKNGSGVMVNGEPASFSTNGQWIHQVSGLNLGENTIAVTTTDKFGRDSSASEIIITFKDPADVDYPSSDDSIPLTWKSVSTPSFGPDDIKKIADTIDSIFDPIIDVLDFVSRLLDGAKSFIKNVILDPTAAFRKAIQALIDNITEILDRLMNGAGLYTLSTLPEISDIKAGMNLETFFDHIKGDFPEFFHKIRTSFDDPLDPNRPQLSDESTVGGMVLAIGDGVGAADFIQATKSLLELYNKQKMDYGLGTVNNLKAEGQNQRNVLTWTSPDGGASVIPYDYLILRAKVSGGDVTKTQVKTQVSSKGKGNQHYEEELYDSSIGGIVGHYEEIGKITNYRVMKEYRFIDGNATLSEKSNETGLDKYVNGTVDFFEAVRDYVLVRTGSNEIPLVNGETWYYKVVPQAQGTDVQGQSSEVKATPSLPNIEERTEYLYDQIKKRKAGWYQVSGSIFNRDDGVLSSNPKDVKIVIDGSLTVPSKISAEKGLIYLSKSPKQTLEVTYWGKKIQKTTRASLVSLHQGPFTFTEEKNTMGIQVGKGATITETFGGTPITRTQNITFTRFKKNETEVSMSAEDVASVIRSQTAGLKVIVDRRNRIVLEEDQNPDIYRGSQLEIKISNPILGFVTDKDKSYFGVALDNNKHTKNLAGPLGGTPPDWKALRISDLFPEVNDLLRYMNTTFDSLLKSLESATISLTDFIDLLQTKIDALSDMIIETQDLLKKMTDALTIKGGFYCLAIPPNSGGASYFNEAIQTATGYPEDAEYAGGIVLLYTDGGTGVALDWIISSLS